VTHDGAVTAFVIAVTIVAYVVSREIFLRTHVTLLNPVFVSTIVIILVLFAFGIRGDQYQPGRELMTLLLGPATVALAVPLYRHRRLLVTYWTSIALGIVCGSVATIVTVVLFARWVSLDRMLVLAVAPKSVSTPVAIDIARILGTNLSITAVLVVSTGMVGAIVGPRVLTAVRISDAIARGVAIGTTSHATGTAAILHEGETQGAMSAVAMALTAIFTAFVGPFLIPWLVGIGQ
jgi:predicted murein hydrolase (TIGR00659 family)